MILRVDQDEFIKIIVNFYSDTVHIVHRELLNYSILR